MIELRCLLLLNQKGISSHIGIFNTIEKSRSNGKGGSCMILSHSFIEWGSGPWNILNSQ